MQESIRHQKHEQVLQIVQYEHIREVIRRIIILMIIVIHVQLIIQQVLRDQMKFMIVI